MQLNETIEIHYNKAVLGLFFCFAVLFFIGGFVLFTIPPEYEKWSLSFHFVSKFSLMGVGCILLGLFGGNFLLEKLRDKSPALVIDNEEFTINKDEPIVVTWGKIDRIETQISTYRSEDSEYKEKLLVPVLKNPEEYLSSTANKFLSFADKFGLDAKVGPPITISTKALECSFEELKRILETKLQDYKNQHPVKGD